MTAPAHDCRNVTPAIVPKILKDSSTPLNPMVSELNSKPRTQGDDYKDDDERGDKVTAAPSLTAVMKTTSPTAMNRLQQG